jgi:hypothetical protein
MRRPKGVGAKVEVPPPLPHAYIKGGGASSSIIPWLIASLSPSLSLPHLWFPSFGTCVRVRARHHTHTVVLLESRFRSSISDASMGRSPGEVYTPYVCRTTEVLQVGTLHLMYAYSILRSASLYTFINNVRLECNAFGLQGYKHGIPLLPYICIE